MATLLSDLRAGAQELADKVNDASISTATWNVWVNQGIEDLHKRLRQTDPEIFYKTKDFVLAGGAGAGSQYDLSVNVTDFRSVRFVELNPDTTNRRKIRRFNFNEKDGSQRFYPWCPTRRYRQMGLLLIIEPYEFAGGNYRLYYRQGPTVLVADGNAIDTILEQWSEYPMCFAAIKGLGKEESDVWPATRLEELRADIEASGNDQDDGEPDVVTDADAMDIPIPWGR